MAITLLPTPPSRQDPINFNVRADEFLGALPTFGAEANSLATDVNNKQVTVSNAATTATNAASTATTKAGEASTSAWAASVSRIAAEAALDSFDDRYLGQKLSNPTADNDGGALLVGALYFRTTAPTGMKVWTGTAWDDAYANLSAKFDKTGGVISGGISVAGNVLATGGALGYGVGAGGTAIQPTSNTTAVVLNKPNGTITLASGAIPGSGLITFEIQNSLITDKSIVVVHGCFDGSSAAIAQFLPQVAYVQSGRAYIQIKNNNAVQISTDNVKIKFAVFEGSSS